MKPTTNRLLVQIIKQEEDVTKGNMMMTALVLDTGPDVKHIKPQDVVVFSPYGFDEVMVGKEKMVIIDDTLILAISNAKSIKKAN
jgi:co-chaperonin GroES (HSP10)